MNPFSSCTAHAIIGVIGTLLLILSGSGGFAGILITRKISKLGKQVEAFEKLFSLRFTFNVAYHSIGTFLLLVAYVLGVIKDGMGSPKAISTLTLIIICLLVLPILGFFKERAKLVANILFLTVGVFAIINIFIGNFVFTSFHNFL